jgi:hypothetical protein
MGDPRRLRDMKTQINLYGDLGLPTCTISFEMADTLSEVLSAASRCFRHATGLAPWMVTFGANQPMALLEQRGARDQTTVNVHSPNQPD